MTFDDVAQEPLSLPPPQLVGPSAKKGALAMSHTGKHRDDDANLSEAQRRKRQGGVDTQSAEGPPPFPWYTTMVTHAGVAISLIEGCGHAVWSYLQLAASNLYHLGYAHPHQLMNWDADRVALMLPGPPHTTVWPYLVSAILSLIASWYVFKYYLILVRATNDQAWAWFRGFIFDIVIDAIKNIQEEDESSDGEEDGDTPPPLIC